MGTGVNWRTAQASVAYMQGTGNLQQGVYSAGAFP